MSEASQNRGKDHDAEVIDLAARRGWPSEAIDPQTLTDSDVVRMVLARATHPSTGSDSQRAARQLNHMIGDRPRDDLSQQDIKWRTRTGELMLDVDALDDETLDSLLARDTVLATMYSWLRSTREQAKNLSEERSAVLALRGLRASVMERQALSELREDEHWSRLTKNLGMASDE